MYRTWITGRNGIEDAIVSSASSENASTATHAPRAMTSYGGPVALYLGDLASFLGRAQTACAHYAAALTASQEMHAPAFSRRAREALAALEGRATPAFPLSPRETEVAHLIGAGMTNREVSQRLYLSERTVENHVSSILRRLGLPNRAAVAVWISREPD